TRPCCNFKGNLSRVDKSLLEMINSKEFNELKDIMKNDPTKEIPGCKPCYQKENLNLTSLRHWFDSEWTPKLNKFETKLLSLNLTFSNECNMRCRMCNGHVSTKWHSDYALVNPTFKSRNYKIDLNLICQKEAYEYIEEIKIVGGEPFISKEHELF